MTQDLGRRSVPIITQARDGLKGAPAPPSPRRMRTLAISLGAAGVISLGALVVLGLSNRQDCKSAERNQDTRCDSGSSSHGGGGGGHGNSSAGGGAHTASFGGFGGSAHAGGS